MNDEASKRVIVIHVSRPSICKVYLRVLWQWPCCSGRRRPSYPLYNNTHIHHEYATIFIFFYIYIYKIYSFIFHVSFLVYLSFIFFVQKDLETSQRAFYIFNISELISSSFFYYLYNFSRYLDSNESESKEYNFYLLKKRFVWFLFLGRLIIIY